MPVQGLAVFITFALLASTLAGCGGGRLIPRDLKDYVAADLKTPRRNVDVTLPFRTMIILRVQRLNRDQAREAERELIESCLEYFRRDHIKDFINDTLVFNVRLNIDPSVNMKYWTIAEDMRSCIKGEMDIDEFIDRMTREENWSEEF